MTRGDADSAATWACGREGRQPEVEGDPDRWAPVPPVGEGAQPVSRPKRSRLQAKGGKWAGDGRKGEAGHGGRLARGGVWLEAAQPRRGLD
ncbi:hypothetical protein E2562_033343 [Oryza meyeriana var. granulata]|uniref:Uncharacterized protein n=1 Tax=Oryza meyeriana var. granulata TaxID=110450 RepID=A0A6G1E813_9ORYZ|nr:hypothetical protein E2562_033343 [Oryza meyeriana var. granulata]